MLDKKHKASFELNHDGHMYVDRKDGIVYHCQFSTWSTSKDFKTWNEFEEKLKRDINHVNTFKRLFTDLHSK